MRVYKHVSAINVQLFSILIAYNFDNNVHCEKVRIVFF